MRYTSAKAAAGIRATFPTAVELPAPADGWLNGLNRFHDWAAKHAGQNDYGVVVQMDAKAGREYVRFHFRHSEVAERFRVQFGGQRVQPELKRARRRGEAHVAP